MQQVNIYHYQNLVEVQCTSDPSITTRRKVMYQRQVKLFKGIDNVIQFQFKNADSKAVNVSGWTINFNLLSDTEGLLLLSKSATVLNAVQGLVTVKLTALDLLDYKNLFYNYALTVTDPTGSEQIVYVDDSYSARGQVSLQDGPYPSFAPSVVVDLPTSSNTTVVTSSIVADKTSRQQSAHHTAQFSFNNFTGNIVVQGTLNSIPVNGNTSGIFWGTIGSIQYTNQTVTDYYNFDGVLTAVRFIVEPLNGNVNPSPVTRILYRG